MELQGLADFLNEEARKRKEGVTSTQKYLLEDQRIPNRTLISEFIFRATGTALSATFDWIQLELFEKTLERLFKELVLGSIQFTANDWADLFNLVYVSPGQKYWTSENKWRELIKRTEMEHYLILH